MPITKNHAEPLRALVLYDKTRPYQRLGTATGKENISTTKQQAAPGTEKKKIPEKPFRHIASDTF